MLALLVVNSAMKAKLMAVGDMTRYSLGLDGLRSGGDTRYAFNSSNAFWHSLVHSKALFIILKNGKHFSVARETNLLNAATLPFRLYTSLTFFERFISRIAWILSRLVWGIRLGIGRALCRVWTD